MTIALVQRDEVGVLTAISLAVSATEAALQPALESVFRDIVKASGSEAFPNGLLRAAAPGDTSFKFDVTNPRAVEWIRRHAADTVSGVSGTTREAVRDLVEEAFEEQFDVDELAERIGNIIDDPSRAETIARTEVITAANEGQRLAWSQAVEDGFLTGTERQLWIVTPDDRLCPICEPLDGETAPLGGQFSIEGPPAHPNCRCVVGLTV